MRHIVEGYLGELAFFLITFAQVTILRYTLLP